MPAAGDGSSLSDLVALMRTLLGEDGCPWDRAQTLETLRPYILEEAHELVEAIDLADPEGIREELGDFAFQFVFCAELARREGWFGPDDAIRDIVDKLRRRHPHVFGPEAGQLGRDEVAARWEAIKREEKKERGALDGVPAALPALARAVKIGDKAARIGLDWSTAEGARAKVTEELAEMDAAADAAHEAEELGDALFALASYARKRGHDPEAALRGALRRFEARVRSMERAASEEGVALESLSADAIDTRWKRAKAQSSAESE